MILKKSLLSEENKGERKGSPNDDSLAKSSKLHGIFGPIFRRDIIPGPCLSEKFAELKVSHQGASRYFFWQAVRLDMNQRV